MKTHMGILMLVGALTAPQAVHAGPKSIVPPAVPDGLELSPDEFTPFLVAHAIGTQGYVCVAVSGVYSWKPFGPQATLFDEQGGQVMTHFLSPRPYDQLLSPTWQHSRDTSIVWGEVLKMSSDANYVAPNAIPWLLLNAAVVGDGPTGGDRLLKTRRIQRLNTFEGRAPATGCAGVEDIGTRALVPYEADYYFYQEKTKAD